jgi:murein DD-endopeptidase MepM/ murein hydrolase activator NlpD
MYHFRRSLAGLLAGIMVLVLFSGFVSPARAASSGDIKKKIEELKTEEKEIEQEQAQLRYDLADNRSDLESLMAQKDQIDQSIKLTRDAIDNKNEQIQTYCLLIAEKQNELDDALDKRDELNERYKARIRSMEENGSLTYWSILFKASSFTDLLDRVEMVNEIANADNRMMDELLATAQQIEGARLELASERVSLEEAKESLAAEEQELDKKRAKSDELISQLLQQREEYLRQDAQYSSQKEELLKQIAKQEYAYKAAVAKENASSGSSGGGSGGSGSGSSSYGFIWPTASHYITCPFGPRIHPITGKYNNHSGMDIGAGYGSPIYACKSGVVTKATYNSIFGYHVVINHGDGFSTLYGHMCQYKVKVGQSVSRGQVIGYVGSTGMSTAPHLHLTMYYNGALVNPRKYLP